MMICVMSVEKSKKPIELSSWRVGVLREFHCSLCLRLPWALFFPFWLWGERQMGLIETHLTAKGGGGPGGLEGTWGYVLFWARRTRSPLLVPPPSSPFRPLSPSTESSVGC
jgi:hypothetical protein